jgi:hypothetical protein
MNITPHSGWVCQHFLTGTIFRSLTKISSNSSGKSITPPRRSLAPEGLRSRIVQARVLRRWLNTMIPDLSCLARRPLRCSAAGAVPAAKGPAVSLALDMLLPRRGEIIGLEALQKVNFL